MHLSEIVNIGDLQAEIREGFVRLRWHNDAPLAIFNYTEQAQFANRWNDVTRECRGLIVDTTTNTVLARPFSKFLNHGQPGAAEISGPVQVTDKVDGSLGILYPAPDGQWAIATRGSFHSEQAEHATRLLRERYADYLPSIGHKGRAGVTRLFEIVYPENRIVLDYAGLDDLVMLGARSIATGNLYGPDVDFHWEGPRAQVFEHDSLAAALAAPPRPNAQGLVVRAIKTGAMVKIKQEDYVALHKIVTGLNERVVWEALAAGEFDALAHKVPDEFHVWLTEVAERLWDAHDTLQGRAHAAYHGIVDHLATGPVAGMEGEHEYRREFAEQAKHFDGITALLFGLLDGQDISPRIWRTLRPVGMTQQAKQISEDTA